MCIDNNEEKITMLKRMEMPIYEDGLEDLVRRNVDAGRLLFSTSLKEGTEFAEVIFVAVGTPPGYKGQANMSYVEQVGRSVAEHMDGYRLLVEKSTVPVKSGENLKRTIAKYTRSDIPFDVASNPEFLREGSAIPDAMNPDRIVVGVESDRASKLMRQIYQPVIDATGCAYMEMNIASAELTKHASNSFLAAKISFINAVSRVCEMTGADVNQVAEGMGLDKRIGPQFLRAGVGYGGSCFPKDVDAFVHICDEAGFNFQMLREVQRINQQQREHVLAKVKKELWVIQDKNIAMLGLAFKPGTDDIREAPSLYFAKELLEAGANLRCWDPVADEHFQREFPKASYFKDIKKCLEKADLVLILTEWDELAALELTEIKDLMACPVMVDGRNVYDPQEARDAGFVYHSVGRA